jgi:flagella basal body P-ring formation protein FlgA
MTRHTLLVTASLAALAIGFGAAPAQAATLRTVTTLHAAVVRLSDLFDEAGANADRVLGPGPGAGGRIVVEAPQLGAIARQYGVDWRPASSADRAVLDRPGRPLRREDVLDAVRSALVGAGASTDCDVELPGFTPPLVPAEADPLPVVSDLDYDPAAGRFGAVLSISGAQMEPIHMRLAGRVDDTIDLPVATTRLLAGSVLRPEDIHIARVRTTLVRSEVVRRIDDAVGMQLRHALAAGQPLATGELARPSMVQKGANVSMQLDSPGIALTAQGQALEAGAIGERIRVLNPASRAVIEAEVIGPDRVRVAPNSLPVTRPGAPGASPGYVPGYAQVSER